MACEGLGFLGVELDPRRNEETSGDSRIGADAASVAALVVAAREDIEIAAQVRRVLGSGRAAPGEGRA
jgi:acetate kinase